MVPVCVWACDITAVLKKTRRNLQFFIEDICEVTVHLTWKVVWLLKCFFAMSDKALSCSSLFFYARKIKYYKDSNPIIFVMMQYWIGVILDGTSLRLESMVSRWNYAFSVQEAIS